MKKKIAAVVLATGASIIGLGVHAAPASADEPVGPCRGNAILPTPILIGFGVLVGEDENKTALICL